jgi:hypothetical protein
MSRRVWLPLFVSAIVLFLPVVYVLAGGPEKAVHVGEPFGEAQKVEIAALLADPDTYVGQPIRLEGNVASYCHHQRGWFALADAEGTVVRLVTAPAFKVPESIEDVQGVGVGTVEIIEIPEEQAKHFAGDHGLGTQKPEEISGPQKRVIVRATGAEFVLPPGAATGDETAQAEPCDEHGHDEAAHEKHDEKHD